MGRGVSNWQITFQQIQEYLWIVNWNTFFLTKWLDLLFLGRGSNKKGRQNVLIIYESCLSLCITINTSDFCFQTFCSCHSQLSDSWNNSTRKDAYIQMDYLTLYQWDCHLASLKCHTESFFNICFEIPDSAYVWQQDSIPRTIGDLKKFLAFSILRFLKTRKNQTKICGKKWTVLKCPIQWMIL